MLYVDTSIHISGLTNEVQTSAVQAWMSQQTVGQLTISDWVVTEFSSALSIKVRTGQLPAAERSAIMARFTQLCAGTFRILPIKRSAYRAAAKYCDQFALGLRANDALHLAICAENGATLCTLDQRLGSAAPQLG
jgi:uncharacterized protein